MPMPFSAFTFHVEAAHLRKCARELVLKDKKNEERIGPILDCAALFDQLANEAAS